MLTLRRLRALCSISGTRAQIAVDLNPGSALNTARGAANLKIEQLAQKNSLKIKPEREADIQRFWEGERGVRHPALLARLKRFSGCYPRYRDTKALRALLKVGAVVRLSQHVLPGAVRRGARTSTRLESCAVMPLPLLVLHCDLLATLFSPCCLQTFDGYWLTYTRSAGLGSGHSKGQATPTGLTASQ